MSYFVKLSQKIKTEKLLIISAVFFLIKSAVALVAGSVSMVYLAQFLQFGGFAIVLMTMSKNSYLKANLKKV